LSFLEKVGLGLIKDEKAMLRSMREAAEQWYNELTEPFLPFLISTQSDVPDAETRLRIAELANKMLCAEHLVNNGDGLENRLAEIDKSSGIFLFSGRTDLKQKATEYLNSGVFLKKFAYGRFKNSSNYNEYQNALTTARDKWHHFKFCKDELVSQINTQLAKIG
jgi:hypothetical protein